MYCPASIAVFCMLHRPELEAVNFSTVQKIDISTYICEKRSDYFVKLLCCFFSIYFHLLLYYSSMFAARTYLK